MVFGKSPSQRSESNRWRADGIRVENVPRIHYGDSKNYDRTTVWTWAVQRQDHLHVNVQRHCVGRTRKHRRVWENFIRSSEICSQIPARTLVIFGTWIREEMVRNLLWFPDGYWDKTAEQMMLNLAESSHPMFRATSALERGEWRSREKGKKSLHFNGSEENIELILRTAISVNQLSISGAVADLCRELFKNSRVSGNLMQTNVWKQWKYLKNFLLLILTPTQSCREICCKIMNENSCNFLKTRNYPNCAATLVWRLLKKDSSSSHLKTKKDQMKWRIFVESIHCLEVKKHPEWEGGFSETRKSAQSWMWRSAFIKDVAVLKSWSGSNSERKNKFVTETSETISLEKRWARSYKETCCESKATTKACCDTVSHFYSSSWKKMDRHQSRKIPWLLFCSVKKHDQIPTTSSVNSWRRWLEQYDLTRYEKKFKAKFDGTSQWPIDEWISFLAKGGGPKKRFQYCLNPYSSKKKSCTSQQFKDIQEVMLLIMHCKDNVLPKDFTEHIYHIREYKWNAFNNQTLTTEYLAYPILQLDTRHAETLSKSWFSSSRATPNKESFLQFLNKTEEINEFSDKVEEVDHRYEQYGEIFELLRDRVPKAIAPIVHKTRRSALSIEIVEDV